MRVEDQLRVAVAALKEISDPITAMKEGLGPDEKLNGSAAWALSNDPNYLKDLAREALSEIEDETVEQEDDPLTVYTCPVCEQPGCVFGAPGLSIVEIIRQCPYRMVIRPLEHRSAIERWEVLIKTNTTGGKTP